MPAIPPRRESFPVHSYEADAFGALAAPALAGYLQEIAGAHADELGVGMDALRARGLTWVLARLRVEIARLPRLGETLEIATWPSGIERVAARREFLVRGADGEVRARATSVWYVFDAVRRRLVRPERALDERFERGTGEHVVALEDGDLPELARWEVQKRFHVRYEDIDRNQHVTNASYLVWALEAIPREVWSRARVGAFEIRFVAECGHGSAVLSRLASSGEGTFAHAVVHEEDGRELARAVTSFVPREG